jgi:tetratricopeptide (TPR) repeat protein
MDADTRHQLKQNELAEALGRLRDFADARFWYWFIAIVIILGGYAAYRLWQRQQNTLLENTWSQLLAIGATDPGGAAGSIIQLQALINENSDANLVAAARLRLGNALMLQAYEDAAQRESLLREAEAAYVEVARSDTAPDPLAGAATYALGTVYESLREFEQARAMYQSLTEETRFLGTPYSGLASARLETLEEISTKVVFEPGDPPPPEPEITDIPTDVGPPVLPPGTETQPASTAPSSQPTSAAAPPQVEDTPATSREAEEQPSSQPSGT